MANEGDLNKVDGDILFDGDIETIINLTGTSFLDFSQLLFDSKYNGFHARLTNTGAPNLDNVFYSTFEAEDADINIGFAYDPTNDMYALPDFTSGLTEYIIVEATSLSSSWNANDVRTVEFETGKWIIYCTSGTDEVRRAQIHKSLWYGTDGSDALMDDFTSVTVVKTSNAQDVDKRATLAQFNNTTLSPGTYTGTFNDTSTNNDCSVWSSMHLTTQGGGSAMSMSHEFAIGNTILSITLGPNNESTIDEFGLDKSADELTNPADFRFNVSVADDNVNISDCEVVILHEGTISWATGGETGGMTVSEKDYTTDDSIPVMIIADTLANEGVGLVNTLIFKDNTSVTVTNAIASINSSIDPTSSEQISISANGGTNYTDVNNGAVARPSTGTVLWRKIVITRATLDKTDKVTEQAVKYNLY